MCFCGQPNVNGQPGYSWDGKAFSTRPIDPPSFDQENEILICDEPGRCGGIDSHAYHFRLVMTRERKQYALLVKHGGGEERINLSHSARFAITPAGIPSDSTSKYWFMHLLYNLHTDARQSATDKANQTWRTAAAEKRIKTRKSRARNTVKVWIEPKPQPATAEA